MAITQQVASSPAIVQRAENVDFTWTTLVSTYWCYIFGVFLAFLHERFFKVFYVKDEALPSSPEYAPLIDRIQLFYHRYLVGRIDDCFNRPITSPPGAWISIRERTGTLMIGDLRFTGTTKDCLNLGSYNYLGFAETSGKCVEDDIRQVQHYSTSVCSTRTGYGTTPVHRELELLMARFVGKEDSIVFGMGYATNSTSIHALVGSGGLIISDQLNHASLIVGMRCAKCHIRTFNHNDPADLERTIQKAIKEGHPNTKLPWTKILIVVEGIYSMEGEILRLPEIIAIKKKYKAFLYIDEAHSIGALGKRGRGVCDYFGVDPADVDILMGTFTKSFGSAGGYIASSKKLIDFLRATSYASLYETSMSMAVAQQIISSVKIILGEDLGNEGQRRLEDLRNNSNYFRRRLKEEGFTVIGDMDSPVVPIIICHPIKMCYFTRKCLEENIGVVVAGFPVTPLLSARARFCISAAHSIQDLENAVQKMSQIGASCLVNDPFAKLVDK